MTAYSLMASNRDQVEQIADTLVERKEMHGDEVVEMLNRVGLQAPRSTSWMTARGPGVNDDARLLRSSEDHTADARLPAAATASSAAAP